MRKKLIFAAVLLVTLMVVPIFGPALFAQSDAAAAAPAAPPTPEELDQLLAPVALYPDSLLAQITTAATNPQEILDVDNWLQENSGLTGSALTDAAEKQGFDPAFVALVNFPDVLEMMAEHVDDYAAIGVAFTADQETVASSIQRLRAQAYDAGNLKSNTEQKVEVQQPAAGQTVYVIQPANPQVVYVPVYDPTVIYVAPAPDVVVAPLITFGRGISIGVLLVDNRPWGWGGWGWNWGSRRAYYNHTIWVGWGSPYRPPNPWYRPRPIIYSNRPGYRNNWRYRPRHYAPPRPGGRPGYSRPPYGPGNRPGYNPKPTPKPGTPRPPSTGRPGTKPPSTNPPTKDRPRPGQPSTGKPGTKPPSTNPPSGGRPGTKPPSTGRPGTKPPSTNPPSTNPPTKDRPRPSQPSTGKPDAKPGTNPPGKDAPVTAQPSRGRPSSRPSKDTPSTGQPSSGRPSSSRPSTGTAPAKSPSQPAASRPARTSKPAPQAKPAAKPKPDSDAPKSTDQPHR